jgi:hypothetical protein
MLPDGSRHTVTSVDGAVNVKQAVSAYDAAPQWMPSAITGGPLPASGPEKWVKGPRTSAIWHDEGPALAAGDGQFAGAATLPLPNGIVSPLVRAGRSAASIGPAD